MKKNTFLIILSLLISTLTNAQVLYSENFDNLTVGNVGTDITGQTPGQGGWYTTYHFPNTQGNVNWFKILSEPSKGKVLSIQPQILNIEATTSLQKRKIDVLINNRSVGNDVIKLEYDFYTGVQNITSLIKKGLSVGFTTENGSQSLALAPNIVSFGFNTNSGQLNAQINNGKGYNNLELGSNKTPLIIPFETWIKCIIYLDYSNKKAYFEIPTLNVAASDVFLNYETAPNYFVKHTPKTLQIGTIIEKLKATYKFDNIKITALKTVPPNLLSIESVLTAKFNIYPNPATNVVNITNTENIEVNNIKIYDVTGKLLSTQSFNNETNIQLNTESLASGTYMLHLQTNKGVAAQKVIKK